MSEGTFSRLDGAISDLDELYAAQTEDDINKHFAAAANILLGKMAEKKVTTGEVVTKAAGGFNLASLNSIASFATFFGATNALTDRTLAAFAIKLLLELQGDTGVPGFSITDIVIDIPPDADDNTRFVASTNLLIPFSNTSPYGSIMYNLIDAWDNGNSNLSQRTKDLGDVLSPNSFVTDVFGSLIKARQVGHADRKVSVLKLIFGRTAETDLGALNTYEQVVWLIDFLYDVGFREENFLKLRLLVKSTESISSLGFLAKLSDFLNSMWPGLSTDLNLP